MAKSYEQIHEEIAAHIYDNNRGEVKANNVRDDLHDIVYKLEEVDSNSVPEVPAAGAGQTSPIHYNRTRNADGSVTWTQNTDSGLTSRVEAIEAKESGWDDKYDKPSAGIPKTDLASDVQTSLGKADTAIQDISGKADVSVLNAHTSNSDIHVTVDQKTEWSGKQAALDATQMSAVNSGITAAKVSDYDSHIVDTDIHVTASDKTTWNGKYDKPTGGIPSSDMASAVQTSLGKADTSIQEVKVNGTALTPATGSVDIPLASASTAGVFMDAASDGKHYVRKDGSWVEVPGDTITDVKVNGTSVVGIDKVANIPLGSASQSGVVNGSTIDSPVLAVGINGSGTLTVEAASASKAGVLHDVPSTNGSYIRKRDAAATWELLDTATIVHTSGTPSSGKLASWASATEVKATDVIVDDAAHTLTGATDGNFASAKATKAYVDTITAAFAGALIWKGTVADEAAITALGTPALGWEVIASANFTHSTLGAISAGDALIYNGTTWQHVKLTIDITAGSSALIANTDVTLATVKGIDIKANMPTATASSFGAVKAGDNVVNTSGVLSVPEASTSTKGVINDVPAATTSDVEYVRKRKSDGTVEWAVNSGGASGVTDVKVNGSSVVSSGVASIPAASAATLGVVKIGTNIEATSAGVISVPDAAVGIKGAIEDASASDNKYYSRRNGAWTEIPTATTSAKGVVQVGDNINVSSGKISVPKAFDDSGNPSFGVVKTSGSIMPPDVSSYGNAAVVFDPDEPSAAGNGLLKICPADSQDMTDAVPGVILDAPSAAMGSTNPVKYARVRLPEDQGGGVEWQAFTIPTDFVKKISVDSHSYAPDASGILTFPVADGSNDKTGTVSYTNAFIPNGSQGANTRPITSDAAASAFARLTEVKTSLDAELVANTIYNLGDLSSAPSFTLPSSPSAADEFTIEFNATGVFTFPTPTGCKWLGGTALETVVGHSYTVCIRNGRILYSEFY